MSEHPYNPLHSMKGCEDCFRRELDYLTKPLVYALYPSPRPIRVPLKSRILGRIQRIRTGILLAIHDYLFRDICTCAGEDYW